ncbi:hypothetical protein B566_EDAN007489 [Ephemera danica]|nr:hypothetical protein B566_EDAN007489 [Ephemera danica]
MFCVRGRNHLKRLKRQCPHIKLSLSVHQENGSSAFSSISPSPSLRKQFVNSVYGYVRDYEYDGVDLNLNLENASEFAMTTNKSNIVLLIKDLREALDKDHILTASLSKDLSIIDAAYDIPAFAEQLQYLHVKSFDYHGAEEGLTGPAAPLRSRDSSSVVATIEQLKSRGAPCSKLVLGVPMFGRTFLLKELAGNQPFGSAVEGAGMKGPFTNTTDMLGDEE